MADGEASTLTGQSLSDRTFAVNTRGCDASGLEVVGMDQGADLRSTVDFKTMINNKCCNVSDMQASGDEECVCH